MQYIYTHIHVEYIYIVTCVYTLTYTCNICMYNCNALFYDTMYIPTAKCLRVNMFVYLYILCIAMLYLHIIFVFWWMYISEKPKRYTCRRNAKERLTRQYRRRVFAIAGSAPHYSFRPKFIVLRILYICTVHVCANQRVGFACEVGSHALDEGVKWTYFLMHVYITENLLICCSW